MKEVEEKNKYKVAEKKPGDEIGDRVVSVYDLAKAIGRKFAERGEPAEHLKTAEFVMGFFGYDDRIIDNILTGDDRNVFRMLEDAELLKSYREEYGDIFIIQRGKVDKRLISLQYKPWRISYWELKKDEIFKQPEKKKKKEKPKNPYQEIFKNYPESEKTNEKAGA